MSREIKQAERPDSVNVAPSKHTPGPWNVTIRSYSRNQYLEASIVGPNNEDIGFVNEDIGFVNGTDGCDEPTIYPVEANARLIAAAPDLLAALQGMVELHGGLGVSAQVAIAAIAKATGTS